MINTIAEFAQKHGCENAYRLYKRTGLDRATADRLWRDPEAYPSRKTQHAICVAFNAQPGEFLRYVPDDKDVTLSSENG